MFLSTLVAAIALAATTVAPVTVSPLTAGAMHKSPDTRVTITLANDSNSFRDVSIDGRMYEIAAHQRLHVKGPAGTEIHAGSRTPVYRRGDLMMALTSDLNQRTVDLR